VKYGHQEPHLPGANPATWQWRVRGAMMSDPGVVVVVSVGLSVLIALVLTLLAVWHLETYINTRNRHPPPDDEDIH